MLAALSVTKEQPDQQDQERKPPTAMSTCTQKAGVAMLIGTVKYHTCHAKSCQSGLNVKEKYGMLSGVLMTTQQNQQQ